MVARAGHAAPPAPTRRQAFLAIEAADPSGLQTSVSAISQYGAIPPAALPVLRGPLIVVYDVVYEADQHLPR